MAATLTQRKIEDWTNGAAMDCLVCTAPMPEGDDCPNDHYEWYDCAVNNGHVKTTADIHEWVKRARRSHREFLLLRDGHYE